MQKSYRQVFQLLHVFRCCCEEASIIFVRLEQHDVELGQKVESQGDIGGERETDAGGDHLEEKY